MRNASLELMLCRCCVSESCVSFASLDVVSDELSDGVQYDEFDNEFKYIHSVKYLAHV